MVDEVPGDILVVDDNRGNLLAIEAALGDFAPHVVKASSGAEALRYLLTQDFALILLDVQMPTMDGFETARIVRERTRSRVTPIIFLTAHTRNDRDVRHAYELGAVDFLFKPVVPEILRAKVSVFVELQRRTAEVKRQAALLREHERREHERLLTEERRRWEEEALRRQMEEERRAAAAVSRKAEELAATVAQLERAERELTRMNQELAEADRRKDEFLAVLAHELRNPLAPIVTGLELLRLRMGPEPADAVMARACTSMERQVSNLRRLVDDLLDVSRITSGKIELRTARIDLVKAVQEAVATTESTLAERGHRIRVELPEEPVWVLADTIRIVQVVANLLNNSARYTEREGEIRVACRAEAGAALIRVSDNGRGIAPHRLDRIFDMFVQEDRGAGGLGVGLALVQRLVALHGGTVEAKSPGLGLGSEFCVRLPRLEQPETLPPARPSWPPPPGLESGSAGGQAPLRIVVIEDNEDIRESVAELLRTWGHDVECAPDGMRGVELVLRTLPEVALVDIGLPGLDGCGVAARLRESLPKDRLRLVAVTGFGQERDRSRIMAAGFDAHLVKPASAETLRQALSAEVSRSRAPSMNDVQTEEVR